MSFIPGGPLSELHFCMCPEVIQAPKRISLARLRREVMEVILVSLLIVAEGHILITTYEGIRINQEELLKHRWEYIVMDEGHKIRNPDAEITLTVKKFPVCDR